jgi:hypothetical protein
MRTWILILGLAFAAVAQDAPKDDGLILTSHLVDLQVNENLGVLKVQFKVKNPTDRPLEGDVSFSAPRGAAVYEAGILKHIVSTQRKSKVLNPDRAASLYSADKNKQLNGTDDVAAGAMARGGGMNSATSARMSFPPTSPFSGTPKVMTEGPTNNPFLMNAYQRHMAGYDPALVEFVSGDRYRLRFFPVPARDDQTVTLWMAFEVRKEPRAYAATVPLRLDSNFSATAATRAEIRIALSSADALPTVTCSSHALKSIERDEDGHRFAAVADAPEGVAELVLSYGPGFWARPHDFAPDAKSGEAPALRAVRARRALERAEEPVRAGLALSTHVVTAYGSFLVIEANDARDLARSEGRTLRPESVPAAPVFDEDAKQCDFVRALLKLPALSRSAPCEIRTVSTNDPAKLQWARDNGITSGRSNTLLSSTSFEYVKHATGCAVHEPNVEKLRQRSELLKR